MGVFGIHSCATPDGIPAPECNEDMARNATKHGVPWGVIEGFGKYTKPSSMMWLGAEDAECWGLMRWNSSDTSNDGIACFAWTLLTNKNGRPAEVTAKNANDLLCRMNAAFSPIYVSTGRDGQGFSNAYRRGCERIAADPKTPKYAAIDIIMWLTLTDPNIWALRPPALLFHILDSDESQIDNCWKCFTIFGMFNLTHGRPKEAVENFQRAANLVQRDTGSVPAWLTSRLDIAVSEAAKPRPDR